MGFAVNQRVHIKQQRHAFGGVTGVIALFPGCLVQIDPTPWIGPFQYKQRGDRQVILYWVEFDEPTDDGSGHGPYRAAETEEEFLELGSESL